MTTDQEQVLTVNGVEIPAAAIAEEAQNHPSDNPDAAWSEAARALAIKTVLLAEADRLAIEAPLIEDEKGRTLLPDDARIEALLEQQVTTPHADDAVCRRYYEQNLDQFQSPALVEASHILFSAPQDEPARYTKAELSAIDTIAELKTHPERFAALAETLSACPSGKQGGNLGQIGPGQTVDEFETFLFNLEADQMCPVPVKTRFGVHVIRAGRKIPGETVPFEAVRSKIADYLEESSWRRAVSQYLKILIGKAEISGLEIEGSEGLLVQ